MAPSLRPWFLYLLECRDGSYYAGISTDVDARFAAHQAGKGALKTPKDQWDRRCTVLDVTGNAASVRLETPWFVDYFHMGRFDQRWVIVNALWYPKPKAQ